MHDMYKPKNIKRKGKELLNSSFHGTLRRSDSDVTGIVSDQRDRMSASLHGLRRSPSSTSSTLARGRSLLNNSLHGYGSWRKDTTRSGTKTLSGGEELIGNSFPGKSSGRKTTSPLAKGRSMLNYNSMSGSFKKDFISAGLHGHGRSKTYPLSYSLGTVYEPTSRGCMKVLTLEESLNSVRKPKRSPRDEISALLRGFEEEPVEKKVVEKRRSPNYCVRFAVVTVREYQTCISDNPSALDGLPISIGWQFTEISPIKVNEFESTKGPKLKEEDLRLNYFDRYEILRRVGLSSDEIEQAAKQNKKLLTETSKFRAFFKKASSKKK